MAGNHSETIRDQQSIEITASRHIEISQNSISQAKEQLIDVGHMYQILVDGNVNFISDSDIILKTKHAYISISENKILLKGEKEVSLNANKIFFDKESKYNIPKKFSIQFRMLDDDGLPYAYTNLVSNYLLESNRE